MKPFNTNIKSSAGDEFVGTAQLQGTEVVDDKNYEEVKHTVETTPFTMEHNVAYSITHTYY